EGALSYASRKRTQIWVSFGFHLISLYLVGERELVDGGLVLVRMAGPGAVHAAVGFVLLVLLKYCQCTRIELGVSAVRIELLHAANGKTAADVTNLDQQIAQVLEELHIVRNGVAVGQHPLRIAQVEVYERCHVIPAAEVETQNVIAQVVE